MTTVKMLNVTPQCQQVSADICRGDGSGLMQMARGSRGGRGSKNGTFCGHSLWINDQEPLSCNLSLNLSGKNAKP